MNWFERFNGGDRCFGGLTDMRIEAPDKISMTRNFTPYELVTLGIAKNKLAKSYGDLPDCALCCIGEYTEMVDLKGQSELVEVRLNGTRLEQGKGPFQTAGLPFRSGKSRKEESDSEPERTGRPAKTIFSKMLKDE